MPPHTHLHVFGSLHPQLFIFGTIKAEGVDFTQCVTHGSFLHLWQETAYNMFHFVTLYIFPLLVMIFCYTRIFTKINGQIHKNKGVCHLCHRTQPTPTPTPAPPPTQTGSHDNRNSWTEEAFCSRLLSERKGRC